VTEQPPEEAPGADFRGGSKPIRELEVGRRTYLVATVEPLDVTGVRTVAVGVVAWLAALLILLPFYGELKDDNRGWWLWTCLAGLGLGLMGLEYCRRRRHRLATRPRQEPEPPSSWAPGNL
jgi:Protein of unknown function (DUF2530)